MFIKLVSGVGAMALELAPGEHLPSELRALVADVPWAASTKRITATVDPTDPSFVELVEEGCCLGGAAWTGHHYPAASKLVTSALREGTLAIYDLCTGNVKPELVPGIRPAGIGAVSVDRESAEVHVTYHGLGGGGVGACLSRGLAEGVLRIVVHEPPGGSRKSSATLVLPLLEKVVLGVDDTDTEDEGSTWSLCHTLGSTLQEKGQGRYLYHALVQLYPSAPHRTRNCVATAITLAVPPDGRDALLSSARDLLEKWTLSEHTGMAWLHGRDVPPALSLFGRAARGAEVSVEDAFSTAATLPSIGLEPITGRRGCIGAMAALSYHRKWRDAVTIPVIDR